MVLATFDYEQFFDHITPDSANVLWKSDSKAFVLSRMMSRGASGSEIYAFAGGKWQLVEMPRGFQTKFSKDPEWHGVGKGWFVVVSWMPGDLLKVNSREPMLKTKPDGTLEGDDVSSYWIYYKLSADVSGARLTISKVEEKSAEEKSQEDQDE